MSLNLANLIFNFWSGLLLDRKCKESWELSTGQNFIQWIASQPLSLLLNNQFYPVDNFVQFFEQPSPDVLWKQQRYIYNLSYWCIYKATISKQKLLPVAERFFLSLMGAKMISIYIMKMLLLAFWYIQKEIIQTLFQCMYKGR
jgi:hypothetical protein